MERVTISMSEDFAEELQGFMAAKGYDNRSEAIRDLARRGLEKSRMESGGDGDCLAALVYVFNHHTRELAKRLTQAHHRQHDIEIATMHIHLDHENCVEVAVLRGEVAHVREFANSVIAERGVQHGQVSFIPIEVDAAQHGHGDHGHPHRHEHLRPRN